MNQSNVPKWIQDDRVLYDQNTFQYYEEGEDEPDLESLNNIAEMLGLPKNMYQQNDESK